MGVFWVRLGGVGRLGVVLGWCGSFGRLSWCWWLILGFVFVFDFRVCICSVCIFLGLICIFDLMGLIFFFLGLLKG